MKAKSILKEKLLRGETLKNGWLSNANVWTANLFGRFGFDSVTIDTQHGLTDYVGMVEGLSGLQSGESVPIVRVAWNEPSLIQKALDAGALGIICPMVNSEEEARLFVESMYYPPKGSRSMGPIRASVVYDDYVRDANEELVAIPMIETPEAVASLEKILDVEGVEGVYVGPSDLSITHGLKAGVDREESEILKVMEGIVEKVEKRGYFAGLHTSDPAYSVRAKAMGFRFVTLMSDTVMLQRGLGSLKDLW